MTVGILKEVTTEVTVTEAIMIEVTVTEVEVTDVKVETLVTVETFVTVGTLGIQEGILAMKDDANETIEILEMGAKTETQETGNESENATGPCDPETIEIQTVRGRITDATTRGKTLARAIAT